MQQYRVNYSLLIALAIGAVVCSGAVFALWKFQLERKSGWLISEAEKSREEKNYQNATQYYSQYLSIHPENKDAWINYANTYVDLTEQDDADFQDVSDAWRVLESTLRRDDISAMPEAKTLRRRFIDLNGSEKVRGYSTALEHINLLLDSDPNNEELQVLRATYLTRNGNFDESVKYSYKLIGYDSKADTFDVKKATAPHSPEVYTNLAAFLHGKGGKPELAEKVMNQCVDINPKSAQAYVDRGRLRGAWGDIDGARADAQKAYQLKPEDADVLMFICDIAAQDKDFEKAHEYMVSAKKLHPKDARFYRRTAGIDLQESKYDKALAELTEGAKAVGGLAANDLLFVKARLQIEQNDIKGARQTLDDMQQYHKMAPEILEYFEASIIFREGKWFAAAEALNKLRPRLANFPRDFLTEIDFDLAMCYERLGRYEMAQQQYQQVVDQNPQNAPAAAGVERMKRARGSNIEKPTADPLQSLVSKMLEKPKAQQDWAAVDTKAEEIAKERKLSPISLLLLKTQIAFIREDYDAARKLLVEANKVDPNNLQVHRFAVQLRRFDPKAGIDQALQGLEGVIKQFGDKPELRIDKADLLIARDKDKQDKEPLKRELAALLTGIDGWTAAQKSDLWTGMAGRYLNLGMLDEGRQCLTLAADAQPNELPLRLGLFALALEAGDDEGMKAAQGKILQIVGSQNDSAWLYTEARRKMWLLRRGQLPRESLADIRSLMNRALEQRPEWQELYSLLGETELLSNNAALALKHFDRAEELGRPSPSIVGQHIRLLAAIGRFNDAGKLLERLPEALRQNMLGPLYAEILFRSNQVDAALKQARAATEADPSNAQNQFWYGQLLARSAQAPNTAEAKRNEALSQAVASMQKATQLRPEFPEAWLALINYFLMQKNEVDAQKALRDAQLVLSGDNLSSFLARGYEMLARWFDAETMYREIYEIKPDDLQRAQLLAAFYLGASYPRPDREAKASPLINQILRAGADGKLPASDFNLLWARRTAAKMLASTGDYQNLVKAEKLINSNSQDGSLLIDDKLALADILAPRPEPISRKKAIGLLEEIDKVQPLSENAEIVLAELYYAVGDWSSYRSRIEQVLGANKNSVKAHESYVRKLLDHNDVRLNQTLRDQMNAMLTIAPNYPPTFELSVRVADKLGIQKNVLAALKKRIPDLSGVKELTDQQKQTMSMFAGLLADLNDLDSAEKIYRDLAARDPTQVFALATFLGKHRSPQQCFDKLNEIYTPAQIPQILNVAMTVVRDQRDKTGAKFDADIERWLDAGLRENPDSVTLLVTKADMRDLQKRYDEAADIYRKLLKRNDLTGFRRAVVLNNLAYLVALAGKSAATDVDPLALVQEAAQILGPNSDILDTRAIVLIAREQYKPAIQDLELSVTDSPTPSKYFHKVDAHLRAGENRAAVEAWQKAESLGLTRDSLNRMEHDRYEKVKAEIDKIRGASVSKADTLRKAG